MITIRELHDMLKHLSDRQVMGFAAVINRELIRGRILLFLIDEGPNKQMIVVSCYKS